MPRAKLLDPDWTNRKTTHLWLADRTALGWFQDGGILSRIFKHRTCLYNDFFRIWLQFPQICDEKGKKTGWYVKTKLWKLKQKIIFENRYKNCIRHLWVRDKTHSWWPATDATDWFLFHFQGFIIGQEDKEGHIYSVLWERRSHLTRQITSTSLFGVVACCYLCGGLTCEAARRGKLQNVQAGE